MRHAINFSWHFIPNFKEEYLKELPKQYEVVNIPHSAHNVPYNYFNEKDYNELVEFMRTYCAKYSVNEYREYVSITEKIDGWLS